MYNNVTRIPILAEKPIYIGFEGTLDEIYDRIGNVTFKARQKEDFYGYGVIEFPYLGNKGECIVNGKWDIFNTEVYKWVLVEYNNDSKSMKDTMKGKTLQEMVDKVGFPFKAKLVDQKGVVEYSGYFDDYLLIGRDLNNGDKVLSSRRLKTYYELALD